MASMLSPLNLPVSPAYTVSTAHTPSARLSSPVSSAKPAGTLGVKSLQVAPPAPLERADAGAPTPLTPRTRFLVQSVFPYVAATGELDALFADNPAAAECMKTYVQDVASALMADPTLPRRFVPTDEIAEYLLPRVAKWANAAAPCAAADAIVAGCNQRVAQLKEARRLPALVAAGRCANVPPSDEIFVLCNLFMDAEGKPALDWLEAEDARWLLRNSRWAPAVSRLLAAKADVTPPTERPLRTVSGPAKDFVLGVGKTASTYAGTVEATGFLSCYQQAKGYGVLTWPDGSTYAGTFVKGRRHGWGVFTDAIGRFEGDFANDQRNGRGVMYWPSGSCLDVETKNNQWNGRGVLVNAQGHRFDGQYKDSKKNGHGVWTWIGGGGFEGEFANSLANGHGVLTLPNGDRLSGPFKDDLRHGSFVRTDANGVSGEEEYQNDTLIQTVV